MALPNKGLGRASQLNRHQLHSIEREKDQCSPVPGIPNVRLVL